MCNVYIIRQFIDCMSKQIEIQNAETKKKEKDIIDIIYNVGQKAVADRPLYVKRLHHIIWENVQTIFVTAVQKRKNNVVCVKNMHVMNTTSHV